MFATRFIYLFFVVVFFARQKILTNVKLQTLRGSTLPSEPYVLAYMINNLQAI